MSKRDYVSDFQLFTWFHDMLLELSNIFLQSISFLNFPGLILKNGIFDPIHIIHVSYTCLSTCAVESSTILK